MLDPNPQQGIINIFLRMYYNIIIDPSSRSLIVLKNVLKNMI